MIKLALTAHTLQALKLTGANAAIGAGVGAFGHHRLQKRKARLDDGTRSKGSKPSVAKGALFGALGGAITGHAMHRTKFFNADQLRSAKDSWKRFGMPHHDVDHVVGTTAGAALGGTLGYKHGKKHEKEKVPKKRMDRWASAASGALLGGQLGHMAGSVSQFGRVMSHQKKVRAATASGASFPKPPKNAPVPSWAKGSKTKKDAKRAYYEQASKHHEDHGGSKERMQQINKEWEEFKNSSAFEKLGSFLQGLLAELHEIETT